MDLGATEWVTFRKITLPMIAPGVAAAAMLAAAISFDDYVITSFNAGQTQTFPLFIFGATRQGVPAEVNVLATMLLLAVLVLMGLNVLVQKSLARRDARPHRPAVEPLTPRSRISLRGPSEGRTEHAALSQGWRPSRRGRDDGGASRSATGTGRGRCKADATLDDGLQAAGRGRHRGADRRPARRSVRARARGGRSPCPVFRIRGGASTVVGNLAAPVQPGGPGVRAGRAALRHRHRPHRWCCRPDAADAADGDGCTRAACRAPTASRSTATASCGSPTAGPPRAACGGSARDGVATEVFRDRSRWPTTWCPAASAATCAGCRRGRSRSPRPARQASNTLGSQHLVANGLAFDRRRHAVRRRHGARRDLARAPRPPRARALSRSAATRRSRPNTLCLDADLGPAPVPRRRRRDRARRRRERLRRRQRAQRGHGRDPQGRRRVEYFRNAPAATRLRNEGPLEFPTSPVLVGRKLCTDALRRRAARQLPQRAGRRAQRCPASADRTLALAAGSRKGCPDAGPVSPAPRRFRLPCDRRPRGRRARRVTVDRPSHWSGSDADVAGRTGSSPANTTRSGSASATRARTRRPSHRAARDGWAGLGGRRRRPTCAARCRRGSCVPGTGGRPGRDVAG